MAKFANAWCICKKPLVRPMLTEQVKITIKSTAHILHINADDIAARVYDLLFERYPQTKLLFSGAANEQARKLAQIIINYCEHIDDLESISEQLDHIAQTHVNADVHPGHYTMMGQVLLQAIKDVLGDEASDELLAAWRTAYFYLADQLIERERTVRASQQNSTQE